MKYSMYCMLKLSSCLFATGKPREGEGGGAQPQGRREPPPAEDLNELSGGRRHPSIQAPDSRPHGQPQSSLPREGERERGREG